MKIKNEKGISLVAVIFIIIAIILVIGVSLYFITRSTNSGSGIDKSISTNTESNSNDTQVSQLDINKIKEQIYPDIFGSDGSKLYPPQSYTIHNILSINPDKDERFIVTSATSDIGILSSYKTNPSFTYIIDDTNKVDIEILFKDPKNLVLQENLNNTDIFIHKSSDLQDLKTTRYILLDDVKYYQSNNAYSNYKCYISLKPTTKVSNEDILKIAQHIVIDKSNGEFIGKDDGLKVVADKADLKKKVGDYTFDFSNTFFTSWIAYENGKNEVAYFVPVGEKMPGLKLEFPYTTFFTDSKDGIEDVKASVEHYNSNETKGFKQQLIELEVDGIKFYGLKHRLSQTQDVFTFIYVQLDGHKLARFSEFGEISNTSDLENIIKNRIVDPILSKN